MEGKINTALVLEVNDGLYVKAYSTDDIDKAKEDFNIAKRHPLVKKMVLNEIGFVNNMQVVNPIETFYDTRLSSSPADGGCLFCYRRDDSLIYDDKELNVWIHLDCLKEALRTMPNAPDIEKLKYLLNEKE